MSQVSQRESSVFADFHRLANVTRDKVATRHIAEIGTGLRSVPAVIR